MSDQGNTSRYLITTLGVIGLLLSIASLYSYQHSLSGVDSGASFCNISDALNCDAVNQSPFSTVFGVPLASLGMAFYISLILFVWLSISTKLIPSYFFSSVLLFVFSLASIYSIYLFLISELIIGTLCILCLGMYIVNFLLLGVVIFATKGSNRMRQLVDGALAVCMIPLSLFGIKFRSGDSYLKRSTSIVLIFVAVLSLVASIAFPTLLTNQFIITKHNNSSVSSEIEKTVTDWRRSPLVSFKSREGSIVEKDFIKGEDAAPVEIIEFVDFQCPACRRFYLMADEILSEYQGKVKIVFKNYPLDGLCNVGMPPSRGHPFACKLAFFARCAGEQDKFWEATHLLMTLDSLSGHPQPEILVSDLEQAISQLGLDKDAMKECTQSDRVKRKIESDISDGNSLGVSGTPAVWINKRRMPILSKEAIKAVIESILNRSAK